MAYRGSAAYQWDAYEAYEVPARQPLTVHEGGRETRASRESSFSMAALVKSIIVLTVLLGVLGVARVMISVQTVTLLSQVQVAESVVESARDTRTALSMERSALASADRIQRIATENYGMVYASDVDTIVLSQQEDTDAASPES